MYPLEGEREREGGRERVRKTERERHRKRERASEIERERRMGLGDSASPIMRRLRQNHVSLNPGAWFGAFPPRIGVAIL
jgi:hypothetical protein